MARPTSKDELIAASARGYGRLTEFAASMTEGELAASFDFSIEDLFDKGRFDWTGTTTLGSYFVSATSSHYDWALKKLRAHRRACQRRA